ncbi:MAG: endonuclease/exonuclease/phosphatase family protein [Planctomycetes bacterium]|nr:endonuclease/exonuclease/phosphatase family protein [Planctomycetota bacterium]
MSITARRLASLLVPVVLAGLLLLPAGCGNQSGPGRDQEPSPPADHNNGHHAHHKKARGKKTGTETPETVSQAPAERAAPAGPAPAQPAEGYLFCFWNVENLFDDQSDKHYSKVDERYDNEFAKAPGLLDQKLAKLSKVLLSLNGERGPDILAVAEVESERAADLLRQRLNRDLGSKAEPYRNLLFKENKTGRHIATAILTRLPVRGDQTVKLDAHRRILEGHLVVNGHQLVIIASHWTSRVSDSETEGSGRSKYADIIYGRFKQMFLANRDIDFLVCGDFNDTPEDASVTDHLHATGDRRAVTKATRAPRLFDLSARRDKEKFGTHRYERKWFLFDQIVVSPGLLDNKGWTVLPDTLQTVRPRSMQNKFGGPWGFDRTYEDRSIRDGGTRDSGSRGVADHFPVTVRLKVQK